MAQIVMGNSRTVDRGQVAVGLVHAIHLDQDHGQIVRIAFVFRAQTDGLGQCLHGRLQLALAGKAEPQIVVGNGIFPVGLEDPAVQDDGFLKLSSAMLESGVSNERVAMVGNLLERPAILLLGPFEILLLFQ
jgi:hypothetical protein